MANIVAAPAKLQLQLQQHGGSYPCSNSVHAQGGHGASSSCSASGNCSPLSFPWKRMMLPQQQRSQILAMATKKKVNVYNEGWRKEWFGAGIFSEGDEEAGAEAELVRKLESRKALASLEKARLLSTAEERLGLTLSQIERLRLLSTAERLRLLSLAEAVASASPAAVASAALPCIVAAAATLLLIPTTYDNNVAVVVVVARNVVASVFVAAAVILFGTSVLLSALQDEEE